jgi:hypothetical protein
MKFVKVIFDGSINSMRFHDPECPTDSSRPSAVAGMVGGAYYKKYLKYKNKYLLNKNI